MVSDKRLSQLSLAYLKQAPISLCVREINRLLAIEELDAADPCGVRSPILDVGCGDGHWWTLRNTSQREVYGVDISEMEVTQAQKIIRAEIVDVAKARPFPGVQFQEIVGNCSLEHVRDINGALKNLRESAAPGAKLVLFVPTPGWAYHGHLQAFLLRRFPRIAMAIAGALNGFFQHWHMYDVPVWQALLHNNGWKTTGLHGLGNSRSEFIFRLFLPTSLVSFLVKGITGTYPNRLFRWLPGFLLLPQQAILRWALETPLTPVDHPKAYEFMIIAEATTP